MSGGDSCPLEKPMSEKNEVDEVDDSSHYETNEEDNTPSKKPKLEEKEDMVVDSIQDSDDDEKYEWTIEYHVPDFESFSDEDKAAVRKYRDQYNASQGYQLDYCPAAICSKLRPIPLQPGDFIFENCTKAIKNVVKLMNSKRGTHLEFLEVICGTYISFHYFFVQFKAKDIVSGEIKICRSEIWRNPLDGETEVYKFKQRLLVDS